jgi:hypothetical protein
MVTSRPDPIAETAVKAMQSLHFCRLLPVQGIDQD